MKIKTKFLKEEEYSYLTDYKVTDLLKVLTSLLDKYEDNEKDDLYFMFHETGEDTLAIELSKKVD